MLSRPSADASTRAPIERTNPMCIPDVLRRLPLVRVRHAPGTGRCTRRRMLVQREPKTSVEALAHRLGLGSAAGASKRCWEINGARPTLIRERLGWQWMLLDGLRREGVRLRVRLL